MTPMIEGTECADHDVEEVLKNPSSDDIRQLNNPAGHANHVSSGRS